MSGLGFLCILRDAGGAVAELAADIAAQARPGDEVILVDDSGPGVGYHTSGVLGEFTGLHGWPEGVRIRQMTTGVRGAGDDGIAVNLALAEAQAEYLLILPGAARLGPGFGAARAVMTDHDLLTAAVMAPDLLGSEAASAHLGRLIFRRELAEGLACLEGGSGGGTLPFLRGLVGRARHAGHTPQILAHLPPLPPLTPGWLAVWEEQARRSLDWALGLLPEQLEAAAVGSRAVLGAALQDALPDVPLPEGPGADLLRQARAKGPMAFRAPLSAPQRAGQAPVRIALQGPHQAQSPLSYAAFRPLWEGIAEVTPDAMSADLIIYSHPRDLTEMSEETARAIEMRPENAVVLLSEEPFWDTLFSPDPLAETVVLPAAWLGELMVRQVNHHRSAIFDFDHIPYFTLTDPAYGQRYAQLFARNAALSAADWEAGFAARPMRAVFMAERRPETFHDFEIEAGGIVGLCAWRTRLAEAYQTGTVARLGASWQGGVPRQHLPDWHADKLAQLDGQAQMISALENTHQPNYLSEKLFDAFACGARPLYLAEASHRVHGLGLPEGAWINLAGSDASEAARQIDAGPWDKAFYRAYTEAQGRLAALWTDPALQRAETERLGRALRVELVRLAGS